MASKNTPNVFFITKEKFFAMQLEMGNALTFDDVRLANWDGISSVTPDEVDIETRYTKNVPLKTPFVSAAMDTVTEAEMAIAVAKLGGIGVIHAALSPEQQAAEVKKVKSHLNGRIEKPFCAKENETLKEIINRLDEQGSDFRSVPVLDKNDVVIGLLTSNNFTLAPSSSNTASELMTPLNELGLGDNNTTPAEAYKKMIAAKRKTLPLLDKAGKLLGIYVFSDVNRLVNGSQSLFNTDENGQLRVAAAVPTRSKDAINRIKLMQGSVDVIVLDTAQGDSKFTFETLKAIKNEFPKGPDVMVGNISSAKSAYELAKAGADGIKVGQGPGSICTTRIETGIGTPQVTAVYICSQAVKEFGVPVCADGGVRHNGDISIAIAAGADSVMMGGMLAGTDEAPGSVTVLDDGSRIKYYRGMGSKAALRDSAAARSRYGGIDGRAILPEGIEAQVPYKGSVASVLTPAYLALTKSMSYVGAVSIDDHKNNTPMMRVSNAGITESHPHDITQLR